jgi:hypothetical protein
MRLPFPSRQATQGLAAAFVLAALTGAYLLFGPPASKREETSASPAARPVGSPENTASNDSPRAVAVSGGEQNSHAKILREMAARDPESALAAALKETREDARSDLLQAVLRGWAANDVEAAGDWARSQQFIDRGLAMAAVFNGAVAQPAEAIRYATMISGEEPDRARDYGMYLIFGLGQAGLHEKAASFASGTDPALAGEWVNAAYNQWAKKDPERALASAVKTPAATKTAAFYATIAGWAQTNPRALVAHAVNFPKGAERNYSLTVALRAWISRDPGAAGDWIEAHRNVVESIPNFETILED